MIGHEYLCTLKFAFAAGCTVHTVTVIDKTPDDHMAPVQLALDVSPIENRSALYRAGIEMVEE
jgi:hypothetical protein